MSTTTTKREKKPVFQCKTIEDAESVMADYATADAKMAKITATMDEQMTAIRNKYADQLQELSETKEDKLVKQRILDNHTLEGVITLNKNTFYGVGTNACIAVFTAHKPHSEKKYCKFVNYEDDGFIVSKHIGLVETTRAISQKNYLLDCWLHNKRAESKFMVETTIEAQDEWLHSFYYFNDEIPKAEDFEKTITR